MLYQFDFFILLTCVILITMYMCVCNINNGVYMYVTLMTVYNVGNSVFATIVTYTHSHQLNKMRNKI